MVGSIFFTVDFIYLFGVLRCFQHCTGHITTGSWEGKGNQCIQLIKVLYCKLPTNGKQIPALIPLEVGPGSALQSERWEARVLLLCHHGPLFYSRVEKVCRSTINISHTTKIIHITINLSPNTTEVSPGTIKISQSTIK